MSLSTRTKILLWLGVWVLTRGFIVAQVGFWNDYTGVELQDVNVFHMWSDFIAENHAMPPEDSWQYPPGAGFLMLLPRVGGGFGISFGVSFVIAMLIFDLIGLLMVTMLARRERRDLGVWVWLLAMPLLFFLPVLRFDMVPTVFAVAALVVIHQRPNWFGALAGIGASVKAWPILVLFGEWDRKRLLRSTVAALLAVAATFVIAQLAFGDQTGFLTNQGDRGLQVEAVAASPWQLRQVITGEPPHTALRFGTNEIDSSPADAVAKLLDVAALLVLVGAAIWWWKRDRAIREGRSDLADLTLARDFVFTVVLLFVITSRVLSPQYLIWLVGLCAVVLTAGKTRLARPAWLVIGATVLTAGLYQSPANFVIRNLALLLAAAEASSVMIATVRGQPSRVPVGKRVSEGATVANAP
jgi:hypothetical protein